MGEKLEWAMASLYVSSFDHIMVQFFLFRYARRHMMQAICYRTICLQKTLKLLESHSKRNFTIGPMK